MHRVMAEVEIERFVVLDCLGKAVKGVLTGFDRIVFKGTVLPLAYEDGAMGFLRWRGVLNRDYKKWMLAQTDALDDLISALVAPDGDPVGVTIAHFAAAPPPPVLAARQDSVDDIFALGSVEEIIATLSVGTEDWQTKAFKAAGQRSPLALKLTLAAVRQARDMTSLEDSLNLEYRLVTRLFRHGEFIEGIRALLIDKDKAPKWNPPTLEEVSKEMIASFLAPLPAAGALELSPPDKR